MVAQHQTDSSVFKDNKRESLLLINTKVLVSLNSNLVYPSSDETKALLPPGTYWDLAGSYRNGEETTLSENKNSSSVRARPHHLPPEAA